jgi:hypothetical protein
MKDQNPFRPGYPMLSGLRATAIESRALRFGPSQSPTAMRYVRQSYSQGIAIPFLRGLGDEATPPLPSAGQAIATGVAVGLGRGVGLVVTVGTFVLLGAAAYFGYRYFKRRGRRRRR